MKRLFQRIAILASATLLLLATGIAAAQETVRIGVVAEFSGSFADYGAQILGGMKSYLKLNGDVFGGKKIEIIVKDTTSFYWQIVLAGARKAGKDLNVKVPELGAQSESDITGQISILENAVAGNPAAVVISPTQFAALGKPIDAAAKKVKIIGIDSAADSKAFTSFLTTDNVAGGRITHPAVAEALGA